MNEFDEGDQFNHLEEIEQKPNQVNRELVPLFSMDMNHLPCESLTEPTELPLSRESVGMDLSRVFASFASPATVNQGNLVAVCTIVFAYFMTMS